jgi:ribosomal protein L37AE/L43A
MSDEQRRSISNGIWLCQNCAKLIDTDEVEYPTALLRKWRADAEARARDALGKAPTDTRSRVHEEPIEF